MRVVMKVCCKPRKRVASSQLMMSEGEDLSPRSRECETKLLLRYYMGVTEGSESIASNSRRNNGILQCTLEDTFASKALLASFDHKEC